MLSASFLSSFSFFSPLLVVSETLLGVTVNSEFRRDQVSEVDAVAVLREGWVMPFRRANFGFVVKLDHVKVQPDMI